LLFDPSTDASEFLAPSFAACQGTIAKELEVLNDLNWLAV
jgi:hypothetical protein